MKKALLLIAIIFAESVIAISAQTTAFVGVNVIPMDKERVLTNQTVLISKGIITAIGKNVKVPKDAQIIDGKGKYLIPGLMDMHTHLRYDEDLLFYVVNGVTTVRNMRGSPQHLDWREKVKRGEILGPAIYTVGPTLSGPKSGFTEISTAEEAEKTVREQKNAGYDFIKVYDQLPKVAYDAIITTARQLQIAVVGHVPTEVGVEGALKARQASIEHAEQYVYHYFGDKYDEANIPYIAEATAKAGVYVCPTVSYIENFIYQVEDKNKILNRTEMKHVNPETFAYWATDRKESSAENRRIEVFQKKLIQGFRDAKVKMLAGTDMYAFGLVPGVSLHQELQKLVGFGLTPYQAIETATKNPGEFLGANFGTIKAGTRAELILVNANPLQNILNLQNRSGVMTHGKWMPQTELDAMASRTAESFAIGNRFINLIRNNNVEAAVEAYHQTQKKGVPAFEAQSYAFNALGRQLLRENKLKSAIEVFKLNVEAYPASARAYESLADAYAADGNKDLARTNYRKVLEINPQNTNVTEKLKKLD